MMYILEIYGILYYCIYFLSEFNKRNFFNNDIYKKIFLIITSFVFGFSYQFGTDWYGYENYYKNTNSRELEIVYKLLNEIFYKMNFSYNIFQFFLIFSFICLFYIFFNKNKENYYLYMILFLNPYMFYLRDLYRQGLSVSIFSIAILNKNSIQRNILFLLSIFIHKSTILVVVWYILFYKIPKKSTIIKMTYVYIVLFLALIFFKNIIYDLIFLISKFSILQSFGSKIIIYAKNIKNMDLNFIFLIRGIEFFIIQILIIKKYKYLKKKKIYLVYLYFYLYLIFVLQGNLTRITHGFFIFYILILVELINIYNIKKIVVLYFISIQIITLYPKGLIREKYVYYNYIYHYLLKEKRNPNKDKIHELWNASKKNKREENILKKYKRIRENAQ